jgi:excisionase family DNA binding protein
VSDLSQALHQAQERLRGEASAPYLTLPEACELARCEHKALRRAVRSGVLAAFSPAGKLLFREADVREWIESRPARGELPRQARRTRAAPGSVEDLREIRARMTR